MREIIGEEAAKATSPDARHDSEEWSTNNFPLLQTRFAAALMTRSRIARILLSSSPAFRILMVGSSISMLGSRISTVAFPMLVLHLKNSPFITGFVAFTVIAPSALAYVPAGALVDHWNPRRVMLVAELLRGLAVASVVLSLAIFGQHISIWFLIPVMVAEEILEIFSILADRRYLAGLMERDNIGSRQASIEVRSHAVVLAGRSVGPFLFMIQPLLPFLADALSFLFSMGSLVIIKRSDEPARKLQKILPRQLARDIGKGASWLKKDRRAFLTMFLMAATSLVAQSLLLMFLSEAHSKQLSTVAIGIVLAASGAGGAVGSICSRFLPNGIGGLWLPIQMATWCIALALLAMADSSSAFWSGAAMLLLGISGAIGNIQFGTYLVSNLEDDMIAKVTGICQMLTIGACALGPVLGGVTIQHYGIQRALEILLGIVVLLALLSLLTPEVADKLGLNKNSRPLSISPQSNRAPVVPPQPADLENPLSGDITVHSVISLRRTEENDLVTNKEACRKSGFVFRWCRPPFSARPPGGPMRSRRLRHFVLVGTACLGLVLATQVTARATTAPGSGFNDWSCQPSSAHPEPVVLLHGLGGNGPGNFATLGPYLAAQGFCVYTTTYGEPDPGVPVGGLVPIQQSATEIASFIDSVLAATGAAKVDLVGHSEGGLLSLYGPKFVSGESAGVARVVAVAPPTHGTTFGSSLAVANALGILPEVTDIIGSYGCPACSEMSPGSDLVNQLNTGPIAQAGISYTIIASTHDEVVTPYGAEFVSEPGVSNQTVQTLCPLDPVGHIGLIYDLDVAQMIRNALEPANPVPVTCSIGLPI